jgi:phosphatidylinositol-3-phosphatase
MPSVSPHQLFESLEPRVFNSAGGRAAPAAGEPTLPRPDHVVIVIEENHSFGQILGGTTLPEKVGMVLTRPNLRSSDPYIRSLARHGASFLRARGITHPSRPNYLALFSGSTHGVKSNGSPGAPFPGPSLGGELLAAGMTVGIYSDSWTAGPRESGRRNGHFDVADVPSDAFHPFTAFPSPKDYASLPTVSFVVPNHANGMHGGSIQSADDWLHDNVGPYVRWASKHNSLLILTWDEGAGSDNHIPTVVAGAHVIHGRSSQPIDHYNVLRTVEDMYGLPHANASADAAPITGIFR